MLLVAAGLAQWKWQANRIALGLLVIATALALVYYAVPVIQRSIYRAFRWLTTPIQLVMSVVILAVVYYGVVTPIGLILRLFGMGIGSKPTGSQSHWVPRKSDSEASRYFDTY